MSWDRDRARRRIEKLLSTVPSTGIRVEDFATTYRRRRIVEASLDGVARSVDRVEDIPYDAVVLTDGVHVYANLVDYDLFLEEVGRETEAGSSRLLGFVHLHYSGMDRLIDAVGAQRVDHHGGRVHAVVLEPTGVENEGERLLIALSLAAAMRELVREASAADRNRYGSRIRVGVESGSALAINGGRRGEPEPLFIGDAANVAAKMADGDEEGVALGPRARMVAAADRRPFTETGLVLDEAVYLRQPARDLVYGSIGRRDPLAEALGDFRRVELASTGNSARFSFFRHQLPLAGIDFASLLPSRSARQEVVSLFADLSGFTKYVHHATAAGRVAEVVSNLHVIRGELAAVLRDFGGRKIRFIGDCIHGVLAEGSQVATDDKDTVRQAVRCAGAMRSSFDLCRVMLPGVAELGLTIGVEYGATPITRIGIRGERSVRCASSKAVTVSERVQCDCGDGETALGPNALAKGPAVVRSAFGRSGRLRGLDYASALAFVEALAAPAIARPAPVPAEPYAR